MTVKRLYISILQVFALCFTMPHFCLAQPMQKLVFCAEGNPETLSPSLGLSANSIDAYIAIYDTLVTYARGETKLTPHLAEYWEISEDGKTYTFHLQQGVKWHSNPFFSLHATLMLTMSCFLLSGNGKQTTPTTM